MSTAEPAPTEQPDLEGALARISAGAAGRDAGPPVFPEEPMRLLEACGAMAASAVPGLRRPPAASELGLVRAVARADSSVGRIFDGHLNAVERIAVQGPADLAREELARFRDGGLLGGVWGGDPVPGEGPPAAVVPGRHGPVLRGVKTFCSGAGGLHRALVLARAEGGGPPVSAWVDLTDERRVEVDEGWYRSHGLRASVSHRVVFHDLPVIALLGPPGGISAQPWFSRDALRTAASWLGMADTARSAALTELAERPARTPLEALAAGRIATAHATAGLWLDAGAAAMDSGGEDLATVALHARVAIAAAIRELLDEAARACGSRPFARAGALDRTRRDLELFLLQHRLDPLLARAGEGLLAARAAEAPSGAVGGPA